MSDMTGKENYGSKRIRSIIAQIRKENQMTQAQLAACLKVTDKAVSRWERGMGFPDIQTLEPLAERHWALL